MITNCKQKSGKTASTNTRKRPEILALLRSRKLDHPTADDVYFAMRKNFPAISLGTVYRNLNSLTQSGEISKINYPDPPARFDFTVAPHSHIICTECGRVYDAPSFNTADILKRLPRGFILESLSVNIAGICADCSKKFPSKNSKNIFHQERK